MARTQRRIWPFGQRQPKHRYSAQQVAIPDIEATVKQLHAKLDDWQGRVMKYADIVPEVQKGGKFVFNVMDRVTFEIEKFDRATNQWTADDTPEAQGVERRLNLAFRAGRAGQLGHLVEEAYLLVDRTADSGFVFETLGPTEIRSRGNRVEKRVMVDGEKTAWKPITGDTTIIRIYTPDPDDRNKANGPHKPMLGLLETMALELLRDQADATSVLTGNGILLIPTEILPDESDTLDASSTPGSRTGFEDRLEEAMVAPVTDRKRGEAIVPLVLYGSGEDLDKVRHIIPGRKESSGEVGERMDRYVRRYASNIDLPAEVILGTGDTNHWSGWKVDENTWAYHLEPRAQQIADAIYAGLIRHVLANLGRNPDEHRLVPNASAAIAKTDMTGTARDAYRVGAITGEAYMRHAGFDQDDLRPDADELLDAQILGGQTALTAAVGDALRQAPPDRSAAGKSPAVILRQAARFANAQQRRMEALYQRILKAVAEDAARAGREAAKGRDTLAAETGQRVAATAVDDLPFLGYQPGVYFAKYADELEAATNEALTAYLRRIATLSGTDYRAIRSVWEAEFAQRAATVRATAAEFAESIASSSFQSGKPARILNSQVRTLTSQASGGANQLDGAAKNLERPTHAGEDSAVRDTLIDTVGEYATQYTWVVGHPIRPFQPHQDLEGTTWYSWQEFDTLDVDDRNAWLPGTVYYPGDHDGCQCSYEVDFVPKGEAA